MLMRSRSGLFIFLLGVVATGCERPPPPPAPPPPAVTVARPIQKEVVDWDEYTGTLAAVESVQLRARVSGYLIEANFQEGQVVEKDQVLFKLDPAPFKAELDRALAQVEQARAQAENAATEFTRIERLRASGGGSEKEYQDARYAKMQTEAALAAAKAAAEAARLNLEWTQVKAPIRGRVGRKEITPGNLITGGTATGTLLTTIESLDPIYCYFDADERSYLKYQRLKQEGKRQSARDVPLPCFLRLLHEEGFPHEGYIDFVNNAIDPNTGTIRGRGVFRNPDGLMIPGLFGHVRIPGSGRYRALLVPETAIDTNQNIKFLRVLSPDNTVEVRPVKLGNLFGTFRVIEEGLTGNERVVVNGLQRAIPGMKVTPTEVTLDASAVRLTAPGSPATQALPTTRFLPPPSASRPATAPATAPTTVPAATGGSGR